MTEPLYQGTIVRVSDVTRTFVSGDKTLSVLRGVHLEMQAGQLVVLYGPSGSGKTTLLNLIGALDYPTSGAISILGQDIVRLSEGARAQLRRHKLGFIFQNYSLIANYTALENIDLVLRLSGLWFWERRKRAQAALEAVGLSAWANHMPEELSGGQRQRIAIARALALRPALILADEPTSGLDTRTARRILALFQGIARRQGTAFLIVSHDPAVANFVDKAYDLHEGYLIPHKSAIVEGSVENAAD